MTLDYTTFLIYATALIALTLPPLYQWSSQNRWWHDALGVHLMAFMSVQAVVFTTWAVARTYNYYLGGTPGWFQDWVVLGAFTFMPIVLAWRAFELIRNGREARRYPVTRED